MSFPNLTTTFIPWRRQRRDPDTAEGEGHQVSLQQEEITKGEIGGRDFEMFVKGTMGARILARVMKCLVDIGMRPQSFHNMYGEQPGMNDKEKEELRRRSSAMVRRLILGAFGVRNYDYFRTNYPTEDHLHIDPVSIYCAVVDHEQALLEAGGSHEE